MFLFLCRYKRALCSFVERHVEHVMYLVSGCARTASAATPALLHELLKNGVWAGWSKRTRHRDRKGTMGVLHPNISAALMPASVGLTRGCMPYQDPVCSQPKKLPGNHFHNAACGPLRKPIPLCRRCILMFPALTLHSVSFVPIFFSPISFVLLLIFCLLFSLSFCTLFNFFFATLTIELCHFL